MARSGLRGVRRRKAWVRVVSGLLSALIAFEPMMIHAQSLPVIPVTPGTGLDQAQNGVPIVNIATPNGKGVSHNQFDQFNVGSQGLILNNGTSAGVSVLGGAIAANANLRGTAARLILNEVTGADRTRLEGATEIFGGRAEYILANPNGITCDGCGFINTPQATLTTGTPLWNADGSLAGLSVTGGDIAIGGRGLDAREVDAFDLVARSVAIAGAVNGNDVAVVAGRNSYDTRTRQATALAADGSDKPLFAIDSSALGGMYAGRIALIGTEAGVGVRMDGDLATSTAGLTLSADGRIELRKASAAGTLAVTTTDALVVGESLTTAGSATIAADSLDLVAGTEIGAVGNLALNTRTASVAGTLAAGMEGGSGTLSASAVESLTVTGTASARGGLTLSADTLNVSGQAASAGQTTLSGRDVTVSGSASGDHVTLAATNDATVSGAVEAATRVEISADRNATIAAAGAVSARTMSVAATGDTIVAGRATATDELALSADGTARIASGGNVQSGGSLGVTANAVDNAGTLQAAGDLTLKVADSFTNTGLVFTGTALAIEAKDVANMGGTLLAADSISITATGEILNAAGVIETANGDIRLTGDSVRNVGAQTAEGLSTATLYTAYFPMVEGTPRPPCSIGAASCKSHYWTHVAAVPDPRPGYTGTAYYGSPETGGVTSSIYEQRITGVGGSTALITAGRNLVVTGSAIENTQGAISAVKDISLSGDTLANTGLLGTRWWQIDKWDVDFTRCYGTSPCGASGSGTSHAVMDSWSIELAPAIIQAGGTITGSFTDRIDNVSIRAGYTPTTSTYHALIGAIKETSLDWGDHGTLPQSQAALEAYLGAAIPGFKSLFTTATASSPYVYETRIDYTSLGLFYGSDYFFSRAGLAGTDYEALPKRLGDAYFDTQYIRDQIIAETGSRWLDPQVASDAVQLKALIDNGVAVANDLHLSVGVALSAEQIAALERDIVWYETATVDGQQVLVPRLYLADATRAALTPTGSVIAAAGSVDLDAVTVVNAEGRIQAGTTLAVAAAGDIKNLSGKLVSGGDMTLAAGGDVVIATQTTTFDDGVRNRRDVRLGEAGVSAGGNLAVTAGNDIAVTGAKLKAGNDASLTAEGDVTIQALVQSRHEEGGNSREGYRLDAVNNHLATVEAGGSTTVKAGENLALVGATLSSGGKTALTAEGDLTVAAVADSYSLENWTKKKTFGGSSSLRGQTEARTVLRSEVTSGADLAASSGGTIEVSASTLKAAGDLSVTAEGSVGLSAQAESFYQEIHKTKSGFQTGKLDSTESVVTHQVTELSAGGDVTVKARTGDVALEAAGLSSAGTTTLSAEKGLVGLLSVTDSDFKAVEQSGSNLVWQSMASKGHDDTTVRMVSIDAGGGLTVTAGDGVVVEYKDGKASLADTIGRLSTEPGLSWLKDMQARDDVAWNRVAEAHKNWDYKSQGLSGPASAVIAIAVTVATQGWGASAAGSLAGGSALTGVGGAMANAAMSSLITQASLSLINNGGDLGAVFKELGSSSALTSLASAIVTAGLIDGLGLSAAADASDKLSMLDRIQRAATQQLAKAAVSTATDVIITGAKFDEALKSRILAAAAGVIGEAAAKEIGEAYAQAKIDGVDPLEYGLHKALHAALGCGTAAMIGGSCGAGAVGGATGAVVAETFYDPADKAVELMGKVRTGELSNDQLLAQMVELQNEGIDMARLSAALAVFVTGAKSGGDVYTGADAGQNAAQNNVLETAWDVACLAVSLNELRVVLQDQDSSTLDVLLAGGAVVIDGGAVLLPLIPGGAGLVLKASKEGGVAVVKVTTKAGEDVTEAVKLAGMGRNIPTRFIEGVTILDKSTGKKIQGTVDLKPTYDRIAAGQKFPSKNDGTVFKNKESLLPNQSNGYYTEYVVPTPGIQGPGPQRLVVGGKGEMFYTPDHYTTFIQVKK